MSEPAAVEASLVQVFGRDCIDRSNPLLRSEWSRIAIVQLGPFKWIEVEASGGIHRVSRAVETNGSLQLIDEDFPLGALLSATRDALIKPEEVCALFETFGTGGRIWRKPSQNTAYARLLDTDEVPNIGPPTCVDGVVWLVGQRGHRVLECSVDLGKRTASVNVATRISLEPRW
jgi:hypothetical protein